MISACLDHSRPGEPAERADRDARQARQARLADWVGAFGCLWQNLPAHGQGESSNPSRSGIPAATWPAEAGHIDARLRDGAAGAGCARMVARLWPQAT